MKNFLRLCSAKDSAEKKFHKLCSLNALTFTLAVVFTTIEGYVILKGEMQTTELYIIALIIAFWLLVYGLRFITGKRIKNICLEMNKILPKCRRFKHFV